MEPGAQAIADVGRDVLAAFLPRVGLYPRLGPCVQRLWLSSLLAFRLARACDPSLLAPSHFLSHGIPLQAALACSILPALCFLEGLEELSGALVWFPLVLMPIQAAQRRSCPRRARMTPPRPPAVLPQGLSILPMAPLASFPY